MNMPKTNAAPIAKAQPPKTSAKPKKIKPITAEKQWSDHMLMTEGHLWAEGGDPDSSPLVYRWNGNSYDLVSQQEGIQRAAAWFDANCPDKASASRAEAAWNYFALMLRSKAHLPQVTSRTIIPCRDHYLEILPNGQVITVAPDPKLGMTYQVKVNCESKPGSPHVVAPLPEDSRFRAWIEAAHPDPEVRNLVQEQCGATLLSTNYQIAAWWYGAAGCGKSTLAAICKAMQRNAASARLEELGGRFAGQPLMGVSLITVDEVDATGRISEGLLKSWISGDSVQVDRKGIAALTYQSKAKWIICSNGTPFFRDKSDGIWRRLCVVPWTHPIPEADRIPDFADLVLREEGLAILNWMLAGAVRLIQRGRFLTEHERPQIVQELKAQVRRECDSVRGWVEDEHVVAGGAETSKDDVYTAYVHWCQAAHEDALERRQFWKGLRNLVSFRERKTRRGQAQVRLVNVTWGGCPALAPSANVVDLASARSIPPAEVAWDEAWPNDDIAF